jgi:hypothetical protein
MWIPFALSLDKYVNKAGTDVGFGCLLAVALLALLYFAGARETRSLRDQLEDAQNAIASLEARMAQALRNQGAGRTPGARAGVTRAPGLPGRPGVVPAPSVPAATPLARVARVARDAGPATSAMATVTGVLLGAPAGAGAPSLGSATKLIPSPELAPAAAPLITAPAAMPAAATAAAAAAAGPGGAFASYGAVEADDYDDEFEPDDTMFVPAGASAAANGGRAGGPAVAPAPAMYGAAGAQPSGPPPRRTIPTVGSGPSGARRFAGRLIGGLVALVVVVAIVVGLLLVTGNGGSKSKSTTTARGTVTRTKTRPPVFKPASVKVSVLNGTGQAGLAGDVAKLISKSGYTVPAPAITNASVQTDTTTTVAYRAAKYRADALRVAKSLTQTSGVPVTQIVAANSTAVTSCATPTATGQAGSCPANVIVTVGTDLESAATGSSGA